MEPTDIVLFSERACVEAYKNDPRLQTAKIFFVFKGAGQLEGRRIRNAYIDRMCYRDPHYHDCLDRIEHSISFSSESGQMILL